MVANAIHISDQFESNGASKDEFSQHDTQWTIPEVHLDNCPDSRYFNFP